jgi:hypothetical protein
MNNNTLQSDKQEIVRTNPLEFKKTYEPPILIVHGSIEEITQGSIYSDDSDAALGVTIISNP